MIQGVPIDKIEASDYYRRFLVLKRLLEQLSRKQNPLRKEGQSSFESILSDLQNIEQHVAAKNTNNNAKACDALLRVDQLNSKLVQITQRVHQKKNSFEGELLKRWRNILNVKKHNQELNQKQKEEKSVSNKNLMYLSAELLKKERVSNQNLGNHNQKIHQINKRITSMISQSAQELEQKNQKLKQFIEKQMAKTNEAIEDYEQSLKAEENDLLRDLEERKKVLISKIQEEAEKGRSNKEAIKQLIIQLRARQQQ